MSLNYKNRILGIHKELGIPASYASDRALLIQQEADQLVDAGLDIFERSQRMTPVTLTCWQNMKDAASKDGIMLLLVSAYRGVDYQKDIFLRKLKEGQRIEDILRVNAAPGYSEHHTGRALDLAVPDQEALTLEFEKSTGFNWLLKHAGEHCFKLSFPKNNPHHIDYEPWHWACTLDQD